MYTQTFRRFVGTGGALIFQRAAGRVQSLVVSADADIDISLGTPCAYGAGLHIPAGGSFSLSSTDLPQSDEELTIYAVAAVDTSVSVTEVVR